MLKKLFIVVFLLQLMFWRHDQAVLAQKVNMKFNHLTVSDGLSSNRVSCIFRDSKDYLWIGTSVGLDRFDSYDFRYYRYNEKEPGTISSNNVNFIYEDREKNLWFGTANGLDLYVRDKEAFRVFRNIPSDTNSINGNYINSILQDDNGNLWVVTDGNCLNKKMPANQGFKRYKFEPEKLYLPTSPARMIAPDSKGRLWIVGYGRSIFNFDPDTEKFTKIDNPLFEPGNDNCKSIYIDAQDKLWITTNGNGFFSFDTGTNKFEHFGTERDGKGPNQNLILDIIPEDDRYLLLAVNQGGINRFDKVSKTFEYITYTKQNEEGLNNNGIWCFHKDREGILWIGTSGGGINYYNPKLENFKLFRNQGSDFQSLSYNFTGCFFEDHKGMIWIGTDGGGINVYNPNTGNFQVYQHDPSDPFSVSGNVIRSIAEDKDHDIWIGTWDAGLNRFDRETGKFYNYLPEQNNPRSISGKTIWDLIIDHKGIIWLGINNGGIDLFDKKLGVIKRFRADPDNPGALSNNSIRRIVEDSQRNIWVCTRMGLNLYDSTNSSFKVYKDFPNDDILAFLRDKNGNLWAGTKEAGICLFNTDGDIIRTYNTESGLPDNNICAIIEDDKGFLWTSTNNGLSRFDTKNHTFRNYTKEDGLQGNQFFLGSALKTRDGELYFGGYEGFNSFYPDRLKDNDFIPPVYVNDFQLFGKPVKYGETSQFKTAISEAKEIKLLWKQSVFSFGFVGINYTFPKNNKYAYMLEGFEKQWNYCTAARRYITYTNLDQGTYTFRVKASNNNGIWNEKGASIKIVIMPPWWKTWWFRTVFYFTLASILFLIFYLRVAFYRNQQKKLSVLVKNRTRELEETAVKLEEKQEEINSQNEELLVQKDKLENANSVLLDQKQKILDQNNELDKHRNQLESLVEERTKELIEARDRAQESDRLKSSFLANLSHEIRTPLNAILGFSSILGEKGVHDAERKEYNAIIQNNSSILLDLINDILDISKIEAGQMEMVLKPVILEVVINDMIGIFDLLMKRKEIKSAKQVTLKTDIKDEIYKTQIITDKLRLEQILSNLISNAIKFTEKGYIELGCSRLPGSAMLEFYVKDTGIGIKEENLELIFGRFTKIEDDISQLHRGTGLGLSISYQLVNLLGGTMHLTSKPGEGSVFYFTIPLIESEVHYIPLQTQKKISTILDLSDFTILVAEDDISSFRYIERLLRKNKVKIFHAMNGREVLDILQNNHDINLILMDIKMPVMDGIEALHEIRRMKVQIPVIAQTAYAMANEVVKLKNEGFDEYISKPVNPEDFYQKINQLLRPE
jgi:signal transduction histidine kinase/ligand-binding sensor domain-containing protein/CheY-like chemotaxis protein